MRSSVGWSVSTSMDSAPGAADGYVKRWQRYAAGLKRIG